jgi:hypothetical protein
MKKKIIITLLCLLPLFGMNVKAEELTNEELMVTTSVVETKEDKLIADSNININEVVTGDLYFAGNTVTINNDIYGDAIGGANTINIYKNVNSNIRMAANTINLTNVTTNNVTVAGSNINFVHVNANNLYAAAETIAFSGTVNSVNFGAKLVTIGGTINGNSTIYAEDVVIYDTAVINGELNVKSNNAIRYEGNVDKTNIKYTHIEDTEYNYETSIKSQIPGFIYKFITISLLALIMMSFKKFNNKSLANLKSKPVETLLYGLLIFVALPITILIAMISVIGMPISIIMTFGYITLLIIGKAFAAIALSELVFEKTNMNKYLKLFITILAICAISLVPYLSFVFGLLVYSYTFGSVRTLLVNKEK